MEAEDFPAMAAGTASPREPTALVAAMGGVLRSVPAGLGPQLVRERAAAAVERMADARRSRVLLSRAVIEPVQWAVVVLLDALILVVIATVHIDRRATAVLNMFLFSTAVAACLILLMAYDRPFAEGGFTVQPHALREIANE